MDGGIDLYPTAGGCRIGGVGAGDLGVAIEAFGAAEWARLRGAEAIRVWLEGDEVYAKTIPFEGGGVPDIAAVAPVRTGRLCWGWTTDGVTPGTVKVAMAHRARVRTLSKLLENQGFTGVTFFAAGVPIALERRPVPRWELAAAAAAAALAIAAAVAWQRPAADPPEKAAVAPASVPGSAAGMLARIGDAMPHDARIQEARRDADGSMTLTIDTADPVLVRAGLARDPMLATLRSIAQQAIADSGVRLTLRAEGRPAMGRAPVPAARVVTALRRAAGGAGAAGAIQLKALVPLAGEPGVVDLSAGGPEPAMRRFLATAERGTPTIRFREWRLRPEPGSSTALRLEARAVPIAAGGAASVGPVAAPAHRLFADGLQDAAVPEVIAGRSDAVVPDAPVLVGIAGRLPDRAVAIVRDADGQGRTVAIGAMTGAWRLEGLTADQAMFARGTERVRVRLAPVEER